MNTPISNADMVEIPLRKWLTRGHLTNVTLKPLYSHPAVPKEDIVVAEIIDRGGSGSFFTSTGFTVPGRGFVRYEDVASSAWISTRPNRLSRKKENFDHIELVLSDGSSVTLADLDQAAFPLLKVFDWLTAKRKHES